MNRNLLYIHASRIKCLPIGVEPHEPASLVESKRPDVTNPECPEDRVFDVNGFASGAHLYRRLLNRPLGVPGV